MPRGGIEEIKEYALSDGDLRKLLGDNIKVLNYPDLEGMRDIDDMFDSQGRVVLLYPNAAPTVGHWVCLIRRKDRIEFFDPYGEAPEDQKDDLPRSQLEALDIERPLLMNLLRGSGLPVFYNSHSFQSKRGSVATCGKHCAVRLFYAPYSLSKYKSIIDKSGMSADDFVSGVVFNKIKK